MSPPRAVATGRGVLVFLAVIGCANGASDRTTLVTDTLVVNPAPDETTPVWRLSDGPTLAIGHEGDSLYEFFRVGGARMLADGRIVVANYPAALRYYDREGRHLMTAGRKGPGPEEVHDWISRIFVIGGDSVFVVDPNNTRYRILVFDGRGRVSRAFEPGIVPVFVTDDGEWLGNSQGRHDFDPACPKVPTVKPVHNEILRTGALMGSRRLATILGGWSFLVEGCSSMPMEFHPYGSWTAGAGKLFTSPDSTHTVQVRSPRSGEVERTIVTRAVPRPLTQEMIDYKAPRPAGAARGIESSGRSDRLRALMPPPPATLHAIGSMAVDALGNLWVRRAYVPADTTHEWWIYDGDGRLVARFINQARFRITEIGTDYLLGVHRDEDDVETIRRYALLK